MKQPQIRELATQLRFAPEEGRIWMDGQRMLLVGGETFADLRDALLAQMGREMARGLMTRLYFAAGQRDAVRVLKKLGPDADPREALNTGGRIQALQGFLLPEHLGAGLLAQDLRSDTYYGEGLWRDSLEDETHIVRHGVGSEAMCWSAIGYCSGYLSQCAGRIIVVREVECRAMGHPYCKIVAQPAERWEHVEEDLRYLLPGPAESRTHERPGHRADPRLQEPARQPDVRPSSPEDPAFVGTSAAFFIVRHKIERVAPTQATVLLLGESGVGKSLIARHVHQRSQRSQEPFIEVNCAAIPEALVESELFGVERGAFSGANQSRAGRFEVAHGGTLFLDEIATLSLTTQGKLLRVLQNGALERLGSNQTRVADVRVIAATNEDLRRAVRDGRFREDLYFRLNVFPIVVPPLRERRDDIPLLVHALLQRFAALHGRGHAEISTRALQALMLHDWPGNIRELENVIERGVIMLQPGEALDQRHLSDAGDALNTLSYFGVDAAGRLIAHTQEPGVDGVAADAPVPAADAGSGDLALDLDRWADRLLRHGAIRLSAVEDALVRAAVAQAHGNITRAAALLGLSRAQAEYRFKKLRGQQTPAAAVPAAAH